LNNTSLEQLAQFAQIVGTLGAIVSLLFVAWQIRHNTRALERNEHNATMAEWTAIRQMIVTNRDVADLMSAGLSGERELNAADQMRLEHMLQECLFASFHIWEKTKRGIFPKGTFEATAGTYMCKLLQTLRGIVWWQREKTAGYSPSFVADLDAILSRARSVTPDSSRS
jgi:hypothetical protein